MERAYTYQQPPVEKRLNYDRKRPDFAAPTAAFPTSTTSASFVVFQLGEDVLIESTTDHHGKVGGNFGANRLKIPASHNVVSKVRQPHNQYTPPANSNYHQQQQVPKIKIKSPTRTYVEPSSTVVSTLPPPPPPPSPSSYNNINLNHINSLPTQRPVSSIAQHQLQSIDIYGSPAAEEQSIDTYIRPPEPSTETIYLPTSTSFDSFEQNVPQQVQFLAPAQSVYTPATDPIEQLPYSGESVTFEEIPSPEQVFQTTFVSSDDSNNNNNYQTNGLQSYQSQQTAVVQQQIYQEQLPAVVTTPAPLQTYQQNNFNSGPVVFEQSTEYQPPQPTAFEQSTEFQSPVQVFQTSETPIQPAQDVFNLPVYKQPRFKDKWVQKSTKPS